MNLVQSRVLILILVPVLLMSCGTQKKAFSTPPKSPVARESALDTIIVKESDYNTTVKNFEEERIPQVLSHAMEFLGTPYRYGGTSSAGIDCSGLICTAFSKEDISLPRSSREMSLTGTRLSLEELSPGDLLFFDTRKKKKVINHVGLVTEISDDKIFFIHSTTSRGVIISSLEEAYWQEHFVMARRIE